MKQTRMVARLLVLTLLCGVIPLIAFQPMSYALADESAPIPLPMKLNGAEMVDIEDVEGSMFDITYLGVTDVTFRYFCKLLNFCGYIIMPYASDNGVDMSLAYNIEYDALVLVTYSQPEGSLVVGVWPPMEILDDDEVEQLIAYYIQGYTLPKGATGNVFPQFYESIGKQKADMRGAIEEGSGVPFDRECWSELYSNVPRAKMLRYMSDMLFFGFDVSGIATNELKDDDSDGDVLFDFVIFTFSNGDAEVVVYYFNTRQSAKVYYKPGVDYYLLDGTEYYATVPQGR